MDAGALDIPPRARTFLLACIAGGVATCMAAAGLLAADSPEDWGTALGGGLLLAAVLFTLQARSPALNWRGRTIGIHLDEGVVLVGFVLLPVPLVVLAAASANVASQAFLRKHPVKLAFNVSVQVLANAVAGLAFLGALAAGAPPVGAAVVVPLAASVVSLGLVGVLLSLLEGLPARRAFTPSLVASIVLASVAGTTLGILALGFHAIHPFALALLLPLGLLLRKALISEYRHQNELTTRRALQEAHDRLVRGHGEDDIVQAGLAACAEALDLVSCEVRVRGRSWGATPRPASGPTREVAAPIVDAEGGQVGELRATVGWNGVVRLEEDRTTVRLLASSLSMALATAGALRRLRESQQGLRDVLDAAGEPIVAWDPEGRTLHANGAARALFGEAGPEGVAALLEPDSAEAFRAAMATRPDERAEVEAWTRDGRALEIRKGPLTLPGDRLGTLLVARDVTERCRMEREAAQQREKMERAERLSSLGILAAGVGHEINNPLTYIEGNVEMTLLDLDDDAPEEKDEREARIRKQLATALAGVERIRRITQGLGVLGRPERPRPRHGSDLAEALRRGVEEARRKVPEAPAFEERAADAPLLIDADPSDLRQIAYHLARNAMEAAGASGHVVARTRADGAYAELLVEDDGPGVPEEERAKLFTPFHTTKVDGTGLGLPIALALARSMGGDVTHEPREDGGARFRVRLPRREPPSPSTRSLLSPDM